jgi:hypothetical protein
VTGKDNPLSWAQRLKRVFAIDIQTCPQCGGTLRVIACIEDPPLIAKILGHVRRREALIGRTGRGPPARGEDTLRLSDVRGRVRPGDDLAAIRKLSE